MSLLLFEDALLLLFLLLFIAVKFTSCSSCFGGDGCGNDTIISGDGDDINYGDTEIGEGSGDDVIVSGGGEDVNEGDTIFGEWFWK